MSGNASRTRGRTRELGLLHWLNSHCWVAFRIDGSADVVAAKNGVTILVQCKSTVTPYSHFGPEDRLRLSQDAAAAGWFAFLWWCPRGYGVSKGQFIPEADWPGSTFVAPPPAVELDDLPVAA